MFLPAIDQEAYNLFDNPQTTGTPERRLLLAILERAILDYVGNDVEEVRTAEEWLFGDVIGDESDLTPFSFAWVCQQLDLDRMTVAETVRAMPRRGSNRVAPWYFTKKENFAKKGNLANKEKQATVASGKISSASKVVTGRFEHMH